MVEFVSYDTFGFLSGGTLDLIFTCDKAPGPVTFMIQTAKQFQSAIEGDSNCYGDEMAVLRRVPIGWLNESQTSSTLHIDFGPDEPDIRSVRTKHIPWCFFNLITQ